MSYDLARHYQKMLRAFERLKRISTGYGPDMETERPRDMAEEFFIAAHHMLDYLRRDPSLKHLGEIAARYAAANQALQIAALIANTTKHAGPDRKGKVGQVDAINQHYNLDTEHMDWSAQVEITVSGKRFNAFQVAKECVSAWELFLSGNQIKLDPALDK